MNSETLFATAKSKADLWDLFMYICEEILRMRFQDAKRKYYCKDPHLKTITFKEVVNIIERNNIEFNLTVIHKIGPTIEEVSAERSAAISGELLLDSKGDIDERHALLEAQAAEIKENKDVVPTITGEVRREEESNLYSPHPAILPSPPSFLK